jgi:hypothetical protein
MARHAVAAPAAHTSAGFGGPMTDWKVQVTAWKVRNVLPRMPTGVKAMRAPPRVAADSEPKRNKERTTVGANAPRLCNRKSCLGLGPVHKEARS